jgi:predicted metal-dependent hydrolase
MRVRVGDSEVEVTGPPAFVEKKVADFMEKQKEWAALQPTPSQAVPEPGPSGAAAGKALSQAQFFKKLALTTDIDRALAAAYYLEKQQGQANFTAAEIRETIRAAKITPPKNPSDAIAKNVRKGFIMFAGDKEGKRAFVLTTDGEQDVERLLGG